PLGCLRDLMRRRRWAREEPVRPLRAIAPAARRLARGGEEHVHVHFAAEAALVWMRIAALVGVPYSVTAHAHEIFMSPANRREELPEVRFSIVGAGPLEDELRKRRVELLGPRTPDEVRELLESAHLLAMPCVVAEDGDRDSMPVVVKEALAMEVPVVASDEVGL